MSFPSVCCKGSLSRLSNEAPSSCNSKMKFSTPLRSTVAIGSFLSSVSSAFTSSVADLVWGEYRFVSDGLVPFLRDRPCLGCGLTVSVEGATARHPNLTRRLHRCARLEPPWSCFFFFFGVLALLRWLYDATSYPPVCALAPIADNELSIKEGVFPVLLDMGFVIVEQGVMKSKHSNRRFSKLFFDLLRPRG